MTLYIVRYGEIGLKGLNRRYFETALVRNIRKNINGKVTRVHSRIYVESDDTPEKVIPALQKTFGIVSVSPAIRVKCSLSAISETVLKFVKYEINKKKVSTFKIKTKRMMKKLDTSQRINELMGETVLAHFPLKVKLNDPDLTVGIEIHDEAYIFVSTFNAVGGLPVGVEGTVVCNMSDDASLYAAFLVMKRGCRVIPIVLEEDQAKNAAVLCASLEPFSPFPLSVHHISEDELEDFMCRRNAIALVTSEELPTMKENLIRPTLRPVIALPDDMKQQIKQLVGK